MQKLISDASAAAFVLLFDEYYSEFYCISKLRHRILAAERIVFRGNYLSVNITMLALETAMVRGISIEILGLQRVTVPHEKLDIT